jgi:hypothetical protein
MKHSESVRRARHLARRHPRGTLAVSLAVTATTLFAVAVLAALASPISAWAAPAEPGSPAARAIARHVAWLGGTAALDSLRDITLIGTLQTSGLNGTLSVRLRCDGRSRSDYDLKVLRGTDTVTPDDAWTLNPEGQVQAVGTAKAEDQRRARGRSFGEHLQGIGVTISHQGTAEQDGRSWEVVRFTYPNDDQYDMLFDPKDGSL